MNKWITATLVLAFSLGLFALAIAGPGAVAPHLYHDQAEIGQGGLVGAAAAHWPDDKWCHHYTGWYFDHHMHFEGQEWHRTDGVLIHTHHERYHHFGAPSHDSRHTRCPLHDN